jgi:putative flippase GtrA
VASGGRTGLGGYDPRVSFRRLRVARGTLAHTIASFGVVGVVSTVADLIVFNLLRSSLDAYLAKAVSLTVGVLIAFVGNRYWAFRHHISSGLVRDFAVFTLLNFLGLGMTEGCLLISRDGFRADGALADNISANVVGLLISSAFKFWTYQRFVFLRPVIDEADVAPERGQVPAVDIRVPADVRH